MDKKHTVFNTHLILEFVLLPVFLGLSISCAIENSIVLSIIFAIFILVPVLGFAISPLYFVFSDEYIEIIYNFGLKEQIKWSEIWNISLMGSWVRKGGGPPTYMIAYPRKEDHPFFVVGEVAKTAKTTKLIKKYYKKEIV